MATVILDESCKGGAPGHGHLGRACFDGTCRYDHHCRYTTCSHDSAYDRGLVIVVSSYRQSEEAR